MVMWCESDETMFSFVKYEADEDKHKLIFTDVGEEEFFQELFKKSFEDFGKEDSKRFDITNFKIIDFAGALLARGKNAKVVKILEPLGKFEVTLEVEKFHSKTNRW